MLNDDFMSKFSESAFSSFKTLKTFYFDISFCQTLTTDGLDKIISKIGPQINTLEKFGINTTNIGFMKGIELRTWINFGMKNILSKL